MSANRLPCRLRGALFKMPKESVVTREATPPRVEESDMSDQTKDCEACYGTGNEARMRSVQPGRKIVFHPCPDCDGTGKAPVKPPSITVVVLI
jgi:DnaJ-class molecular chaperone